MKARSSWKPQDQTLFLWHPNSWDMEDCVPEWEDYTNKSRNAKVQHDPAWNEWEDDEVGLGTFYGIQSITREALT